MNTREIPILESAQRVGLVLMNYPAELADFAPLRNANATRAELVGAIEAQESLQANQTVASTTGKEQAREQMAQAAAILSTRAVGYALATNQHGLQRAVALAYSDVRYGEASESLNQVRALVELVQAWPAEVRKEYRLSEAIVQAPVEAARLFEKAADVQIVAKAAPVLATLALPELLGRLREALRLMKTLIEGQRNDNDPAFRWAELHRAFSAANKRLTVAARRRYPTTQGRIVRTLPLTAANGKPVRLANTNYGPAYTLTVENRSAGPLLLWMAQRDGAPTTPLSCPGGTVTVLTRAHIGPETARYLTAQFTDATGGQATIVVRRVV